jgi:ADP-L-glycero-D-manno-heptose 6-epimerase
VIAVTGAGGFIGSVLVWLLNERGKSDIIVVDTDRAAGGYRNLAHLEFSTYRDHESFITGLEQGELDGQLDGIIHMGACSDTTELDWDYLKKNNYEYTMRLARWSVKHKKRFVYASSAATYGDGSSGFSDKHGTINRLKPLNLYGESKQLFDQWAYRKRLLRHMVGLKYFNVYGPNEYHKGNMRSMVHKCFCQIAETGRVQLFKSNHEGFGDGEQVRDFIYVKDAAKITLYAYENGHINGIINCGTGIPRSFNDLAKGVFAAMGSEERIEYVEMPQNLTKQYQSYTKAEIGKLREFGYQEEMYSLEKGVTDYVKNYLLSDDPYLKCAR